MKGITKPDIFSFQDDNSDTIFKTCINCRETRQRYYQKHKEDINRERREERACNGHIKCECGQIVRPEKYDERCTWKWHWQSLRGQIMKEYADKLAFAKKKDYVMLKKERGNKIKELLEQSGLTSFS